MGTLHSSRTSKVISVKQKLPIVEDILPCILVRGDERAVFFVHEKIEMWFISWKVDSLEQIQRQTDQSFPPASKDKWCVSALPAADKHLAQQRWWTPGWEWARMASAVLNRCLTRLAGPFKFIFRIVDGLTAWQRLSTMQYGTARPQVLATADAHVGRGKVGRRVIDLQYPKGSANKHVSKCLYIE